MPVNIDVDVVNNNQEMRNKSRAFLYRYRSDFSDFKRELQNFSVSDFIGQYQHCEMTTPFMQALWQGEHRDKVQHVIQLMAASGATSWPQWMKEIEDTDNQAFETYQKIQAEIYPGFAGDVRDFFDKKDFKYWILPQHQDKLSIIKSLKGTPASNFGGALFAFLLGSTPFVLSGSLAAAMGNLTPDEKNAFSVMPTAVAGLSRLISTQKTGEGYGKETVESLFLLCATGLFGVAFIVNQFDVSTLEPSDSVYWALWLFNFMTALALSTFSTMPMAADSAPDDTEEERNRRYQLLLGITPETSALGRFLRKGPTVHAGVVGGVAGLGAPALLSSAPYLISKFGLDGTYALAGSGMLAGLLGLHLLWQNLVLDQLLRHKVEMREAKALAKFLGQKRQVDPTLTFTQKLKALDSASGAALGMACSRYGMTFGLFTLYCVMMPATARLRGLAEENAANFTALGTALSTSVRSVVPLSSCSRNTLMNGSLLTIAAGLSWFAMAKEDQSWMTAFYFSQIGTGVGNFVGIAKAQEESPDNAGLIISFAGAMGVFFPMFFEQLLAAYTPSDEDAEHRKTAPQFLSLAAVSAVVLAVSASYDYLKKKPAVSAVPAVNDEQPTGSLLSHSPHRFNYQSVRKADTDDVSKKERSCTVLV